MKIKKKLPKGLLHIYKKCLEKEGLPRSYNVFAKIRYLNVQTAYKQLDKKKNVKSWNMVKIFFLFLLIFVHKDLTFSLNSSC